MSSFVDQGIKRNNPILKDIKKIQDYGNNLTKYRNELTKYSNFIDASNSDDLKISYKLTINKIDEEIAKAETEMRRLTEPQREPEPEPQREPEPEPEPEPGQETEGQETKQEIEKTKQEIEKTKQEIKELKENGKPTDTNYEYNVNVFKLKKLEEDLTQLKQRSQPEPQLELELETDKVKKICSKPEIISDEDLFQTHKGKPKTPFSKKWPDGLAEVDEELRRTMDKEDGYFAYLQYCLGWKRSYFDTDTHDKGPEYFQNLETVLLDDRTKISNTKGMYDELRRSLVKYQWEPLKGFLESSLVGAIEKIQSKDEYKSLFGCLIGAMTFWFVTYLDVEWVQDYEKRILDYILNIPQEFLPNSKESLNPMKKTFICRTLNYLKNNLREPSEQTENNRAKEKLRVVILSKVSQFYGIQLESYELMLLLTKYIKIYIKNRYPGDEEKIWFIIDNFDEKIKEFEEI